MSQKLPYFGSLFLLGFIAAKIGMSYRLSVPDMLVMAVILGIIAGFIGHLILPEDKSKEID